MENDSPQEHRVHHVRVGYYGGMTHRQRGFTLLLATLTASLLLLLGASIFGLIKKEVILSSLGRDSQFAFYAADSGAECALYWDFRQNLFSSSTPPTVITCDGQTVNVTYEP